MLIKGIKTTGKYLYLTASVLLFFCVPVHAYIDPSVATYAIQAIAGIAITLGAVFGVYWRKILKWFRGGRISASQKTRKTSGESLLKEQQLTDADSIYEEPDNYSFKTALSDMIPAFLLMAAFAFMLGYYAPLEIYAYNQTEFWFDFSIIKPILMYLAFALFLAGILILAVSYFIHKKLYKVLLSVALAAFFILYIHGTQFSDSLPVLDGGVLEISRHSGVVLKSLLICFGISFFVAAAARMLKKKDYHVIISVISAVFIAVMFFSLNNVLIKTDGTKSKEYKAITKREEFTFSEDTNFIILLMDSMNGEMTSQVLEDEKYSAYMEDFTFFPDTLGGYSYTSRSIPLILSGQWYENNGDFENYYKNAIEQSPLLNALEEHDYRMNLYEKSPFYSKDYSKFSNFNLDKPKIKGRAPVMVLELKLALYKYMPYFLKQRFSVNTESFEKYEDVGDDVYFWYIDTFCRHVRNKDFEIVKQKQFKYFHLEGAYAPYDLTDQAIRREAPDGTYKEEVQACFETSYQLIMRLKKAGLYDNSVIVIMSDHGISQDGSEEGRQNPAFLIKGLNEHHSLEISDIPVSYGDLQSAFVKLLNGKTSSKVFKSDKDTVRRFLQYSKEDPDTLIEYTLNGNAQEWGDLVKSGNVYQTGGEKQ